MKEKIHINELVYEIEYNPIYAKTALFIEVIDGLEKSLQVTFDETGIKKGALNPQNIFATQDFIVERITFNCFRTVEFTFTLTQVAVPFKVTV